MLLSSISFFFFNDTATTEIYTLSLHDALPISFSHASAMVAGFTLSKLFWRTVRPYALCSRSTARATRVHGNKFVRDRKSTRLNSSHGYISYAVFCLKKKKTIETYIITTTINRN